MAESCRSDEFPELIDKLPVAFYGNPNEHVDEFGIWHKPDDWDDIESVPIEEGKSEVYVLFANHVGNGHSFCRLRFTARALYNGLEGIPQAGCSPHQRVTLQYRPAAL